MQIQPFNGVYTILNAMPGCLATLGVIKRLPKGTLTCCTCAKKHCAHTNTYREHNIGTPTGQTGQQHDERTVTGCYMALEDFEKQFKVLFDFETGQRRLTSISQYRVPRNPADDPHVSKVMRMRTCGMMPLPRTISPSNHQQQQPCKECGQVNWGSILFDEKSKGRHGNQTTSCVYLAMAVQQVSFRYLKCCTMKSAGERCPGKLKPDGWEQCVFRKSSKASFSFEVMYKWSSYGGVQCQGFYNYWRTYLHNCVDVPEEKLRQHMANKLSVFEEAALDWIQLQAINYRVAFDCTHGLEDLRMDALTIGPRKERVCLVEPWAPTAKPLAPHPGEQARQGAELETEAGPPHAVHGSSFTDRVVIRDKTARDLLRKFSDVKGRQASGLTQVELQSLRNRLISLDPVNEQEQSFLPLIDYCPAIEQSSNPPRYLAYHAHCSILFNIGTTAPASQLMRPRAMSVLDQVLTQPLSTISLQVLDELKHLNPTLYHLLKRYLGSQLPEMYIAVLNAISRVAKRCGVPAPPEPASATTGRTTFKKKPKVHYQHHLSDRPPELWSEDEVMFRTGSYLNLSSSHAWEPSPLGGNHVYRRLRNYVADTVSAGTQSSCNKYKQSTVALVPGVILFWCGVCSKCRGFAIMRDAESPRTVFNLIYTHCPEAPKRMTYDNNCKTHNYFENREAEFFKLTEFYIDEPHYKTHKDCCEDYNTGLYSKLRNSALPEQKNSIIRGLESVLANASQSTCVIYLRWFLAELNMVQDKKNMGTCFWAKR